MSWTTREKILEKIIIVSYYGGLIAIIGYMIYNYFR